MLCRSCQAILVTSLGISPDLPLSISPVLPVCISPALPLGMSPVLSHSMFPAEAEIESAKININALRTFITFYLSLFMRYVTKPQRP